MKRKIEWRHFFSNELRATESDGEPKIEGYPAMFNKHSEDLGGFIEKIAPGAFANSLKNGDDVRALLNHDQNYVLGRTTSGTVELREDKKGLYMVNKPPDTQWARDLKVSIERGDITQMSFGFWVKDEEWRNRKDQAPVRTLKEVGLVDVSVVTFPAYPDTSVAVRSMEEWQKKDTAKFTHENMVLVGDDVALNVADSTISTSGIVRTDIKLDDDNISHNVSGITIEPDENQIIIIDTDSDDSFTFRDFEQFDRVVAKVVEMQEWEKVAQSIKEKESEAAQSRVEDKDKDTKDTPSRSEDVMARMNKRLREKILK